MPSRRTPTTPPSKELDRSALQAALLKLDRRIAELKAFDVNAINEQFDANASALLARINASLGEIFGIGTAEYRHYYVNSLSDGSIHMTTDWGGEPSVPQIRGEYRKGIVNAMVHLAGLKTTLEERLNDMSSPGATPIPDSAFERARVRPALGPGRKVFIVHGHDDALKQSVARYLSKLEFEPIILHEQPNRGRTIIEKLEAHLTDIAYVIVLLTPDDTAASVEEPDKKLPRARQNVILELGLFIGALGRDRVCALYKHGVDIPSDYNGVAFIKVDDGRWELDVARELRAAGLTVDLNKL